MSSISVSSEKMDWREAVRVITVHSGSSEESEESEGTQSSDPTSSLSDELERCEIDNPDSARFVRPAREIKRGLKELILLGMEDEMAAQKSLDRIRIYYPYALTGITLTGPAVLEQLWVKYKGI